MAMGLVLVCVPVVLCLLLVRRSHSELAAMLPWLALALQAVICAGATGIGRLGFGARQAMSSRYSTVASLLLLAALVSAARWLASSRRRRGRPSPGRIVVVGILLLVFIPAYVAGFVVGVEAMQNRHRVLEICRREWLAYPNTPENVLSVLYPSNRMNVIRERTETLRRLGILLPSSPAVSKPGR
jgi:hypothetical protein